MPKSPSLFLASLARLAKKDAAVVAEVAKMAMPALQYIDHLSCSVAAHSVCAAHAPCQGHLSGAVAFAQDPHLARGADLLGQPTSWSTKTSSAPGAHLSGLS